MEGFCELVDLRRFPLEGLIDRQGPELTGVLEVISKLSTELFVSNYHFAIDERLKF